MQMRLSLGGGGELARYEGVLRKFIVPETPEPGAKLRHRCGFLQPPIAAMRGTKVIVKAGKMNGVAQVAFGIRLGRENLIEQILVNFRRPLWLAGRGMMIRQSANHNISLAAYDDPVRG